MSLVLPEVGLWGAFPGWLEEAQDLCLFLSSTLAGSAELAEPFLPKHKVLSSEVFPLPWQAWDGKGSPRG